MTIHPWLLCCHNMPRVTVPDRDFYLTLKRDEIWPKGCQFYKAAKVDKKWLRWNLVVKYETEEGIDAGTAIKGDFFCEFLNQIDQHLFEGSAYQRVPKKDIGLESLFELAGIIMVHSVVHGMAVLSPEYAPLYMPF